MAFADKTLKLNVWGRSETLNLIQGESAGRKIKIIIMNEREPINLTGKQVTLFLYKPDGTTVYTNCDIVNADQGYIAFIVSSQMVAAAGKAYAELHVLEGDEALLKTPKLIVIIEPSLSIEGAVESHNDFPFLVQLIQNYENNINECNEILARLQTIDEDEASRVAAEAARQVGTANAITSCEAAAAAVNNDRLWRLEESEDNIVSIYPVPESEMFPKIAVTYSQEGTGEPSPDNIRPIVGIDELELVHTGKNLAILEQGTFAGADGALVPSNTRVRTQKIRVFPGQQYAVNYYSNWDLRNVALYDVNGNYSACTTSNFTPSISGGIKIATIPSNIYYIRLVLSHMDQTTPVTPSYCNFQVEHSSTATDYEPYGEIHPVSLPETLYGGVIDFERGVVRKEWHYIKFNGTENWNKTINSNSFLYYLPTTFETHDNGYDFICSYCVPRDFYSEVPYCYFTGSQNNKRTIFLIRLRDQEERSIDEWKSYLAAQYNAGTPLEICYPLYEPIETTIDLPTIQALQQLDKYTPRQNVITTSKGALSVGYAKSPIRESDEIQAFLEGLGG